MLEHRIKLNNDLSIDRLEYNDPCQRHRSAYNIFRRARVAIASCAKLPAREDPR